MFEDIHKALCSVEGVSNKVDDEQRYRMNFLIQQKMPEIDLGEDAEEQKEQKEEEMGTLGAHVQVKLLRVDNQKLAVEFTCKGGSK